MGVKSVNRVGAVGSKVSPACCGRNNIWYSLAAKDSSIAVYGGMTVTMLFGQMVCPLSHSAGAGRLTRRIFTFTDIC